MKIVYGADNEAYNIIEQCDLIQEEIEEAPEIVALNTIKLREALLGYIKENSLDDELVKPDKIEKLLKHLRKNPTRIVNIDSPRLKEEISVIRIKYIYNHETKQRGLLFEIRYTGWWANPPESIQNPKYTPFYYVAWWKEEAEDFELEAKIGGSDDDLAFSKEINGWKDGGYFDNEKVYRPTLEGNKGFFGYYFVRPSNEVHSSYVVISCGRNFYEKSLSIEFQKFISDDSLKIMEIPMDPSNYFPKEIQFKKIRFYKIPVPGEPFDPESYEWYKEADCGNTELFVFESNSQNEIEVYSNVESLKYLHYAGFRQDKIELTVYGWHVGSIANKCFSAARFRFYYEE